jgi:peptide/nickel transport system permease protein
MKRAARRLFFALFTLWIVTVAVFVTSSALPGDAADVLIPRDIRTPENVAKLRYELGLDRPPVTRYLDWIDNGLRGDWGRSYASRKAVTATIGKRLRNSLVLAAISTAIGIPLAVGLGILSALKRDRPVDIGLSVIALIGMSLPDFVLGSILIYAFAITLGWLPAITTVPIDAPIRDFIPNYWLPVATLVVGMVAYIMRLVRTNLINVLESEFVLSASLRGISRWRIVLLHACPSALLPAIHVTALTIAGLSAGVVIVEAVFNYPGLGTLLIASVSARDLPVVQAIVLLAATFYIAMSLLADLVSILLNPRLRGSTGRVA